MALTIKNFPDPRDPSNPLATAYAWLSSLSLDLRGGAGKVVFDVHPSESAWTGQPVDRIGVSLGQGVGVGSTHFPTLVELMADPEFASAYETIGAKLYESAIGTLPAFAGATEA